MNSTQIGPEMIAQTLGTINAKSNGDADKVAKEFERMTLAQLLSYTDTDNDISDTMFGGGAGERAFKPFLYEEYAKGFSEAGGIGLAAAVKSEILKLQEAAAKGL